MDKERYIGESKLRDDVRKKLVLKIKEGSITPEHLSNEVVDEVIQPLVDAAKEDLQEQIDTVISEGMSPEDREKLDNLPTPTEFEALEAKVDAIKGFNYQVVNTLPTASAETEGTIYLIPSTESEEQNIKDEYITIKDGNTYKWEQIGSTAIDLSGYYQKPNTGIPKNDLANAVQTSLGKADTALQSQDLENCAIIGDTFASGVDPSANFNAYSDTIWNKQQTLSAVQKAQVLSNIGAASAANTYTKTEVDTALGGKQGTLTFDSTPTASSTNPVTSGGVKSALDTKANVVDVYTKAEIGNLIVPTNTDIVVVSDISEIVNPQTNTIYRVAGTTSYADWGYDGTDLMKLAEYAFSIDDVPTAGSNNTVKSGGVYQAIQEASSSSLDSYQAILENFVPVEEDGFYLIDENLYIGAYLSDTASSGFGGTLTYTVVE